MKGAANLRRSNRQSRTHSGTCTVSFSGQCRETRPLRAPCFSNISRESCRRNCSLYRGAACKRIKKAGRFAKSTVHPSEGSLTPAAVLFEDFGDALKSRAILSLSQLVDGELLDDGGEVASRRGIGQLFWCSLWQPQEKIRARMTKALLTVCRTQSINSSTSKCRFAEAVPDPFDRVPRRALTSRQISVAEDARSPKLRCAGREQRLAPLR